MTYKFDWVYLIFAIIWVTMEAYWGGLTMIKDVSVPLGLAFTVFFGCGALGFLLAFVNSAKKMEAKGK